MDNGISMTDTRALSLSASFPAWFLQFEIRNSKFEIISNL